MWGIFEGNVLALYDGEKSERIRAQTLVLAPGAIVLQYADDASTPVRDVTEQMRREGARTALETPVPAP